MEPLNCDDDHKTSRDPDLAIQTVLLNTNLNDFEYWNYVWIIDVISANLTTTTATMTIPNKQSSATTGSKQTTTPRVIIDPFTPSIPPTGPATPNPIQNIPGIANYNGGKATGKSTFNQYKYNPS